MDRGVMQLGYRMNQKINYEENLRVLALSFVPILPVRKLGMELGEGKLKKSLKFISTFKNKLSMSRRILLTRSEKVFNCH